MRKWTKILAASVLASLALPFTALAGEWHQDMNGWWYEKDDGSYYRNGWYWVDGNEDGIAECYYFTNSGYMANKFRQADGYTIDENGAWTVDGVVQTKEVPLPNDSAAIAAYVEAAEKNKELDSMDASVKASMSMEADGESVDMQMDFSMKMRGVKSGELEYVMDGSASMMGVEMPVSTFYTDGYIYTETMGMKFKQEANVYEAMESMESTMNLSAVEMSMITNAKLRTEGDDTIITYSIDRTRFNSLLEEIMGMEAFAEMDDSGYEVSYDIRQADGEVVIDKNGYYTSEKVCMDMGMTVTDTETKESETVGFRMDMDITINNPGEPVSFTLPSTDGYVDIAQGLTDLVAE